MRLLAAAAHANQDVCVPLTHKLFAAYWVQNKGGLFPFILLTGVNYPHSLPYIFT